jgi:pSer/pThr/pTyr-binding forkhead associated (FHA) protein
MKAKVTLTLIGGALDGKEFTFTEPTHCVIGRGEECTVRLPSGWEYQVVSRRHCHLDIDPPFVCVRDLGSRNGTYLNGRLIGQRAHSEFPEEVSEQAFSDYELADDDELWIGPVTIRVGIDALAEADLEKTREAPEATPKPNPRGRMQARLQAI